MTANVTAKAGDSVPSRMTDRVSRRREPVVAVIGNAALVGAIPASVTQLWSASAIAIHVTPLKGDAHVRAGADSMAADLMGESLG
jgi:hypothetical protein